MPGRMAPHPRDHLGVIGCGQRRPVGPISARVVVELGGRCIASVPSRHTFTGFHSHMDMPESSVPQRLSPCRPNADN